MQPCKESLPVITQPRRQIVFAPLAIGFHGVERAVGRVVENGLVGVDERIAYVPLDGPSCRRLEIFPVRGIVLDNIHTLALILCRRYESDTPANSGVRVLRCGRAGHPRPLRAVIGVSDPIASTDLPPTAGWLR